MLWQSTDEQIKSISNFLAKNANQQSKFNASHFFQEKKKKVNAKQTVIICHSLISTFFTRKNQKMKSSVTFNSPGKERFHALKKQCLGFVLLLFI